MNVESVRFILFALLLSAFTQCAGRADEEKIKDRLWLWCHVEGAHNTGANQNYGFGDYNFTTSPEQAANLLGIQNVFMVKYNIGPHPGPNPADFSSYYDSRNFSNFRKVVWSVVSEGGASSIDERTSALGLAKSKPNIAGFIMDDFFARTPRALTPEQLRLLKRQMENALPSHSPGGLWVVVYNDEVSNPRFATDFLPWIKEVDGITLWFKEQAALTLSNMDTVLSALERNLSGLPSRPKVMLGCYMWRYVEWTHGNISPQLMNNQLEFAKQSLTANRVDGVVFLASCIADTSADAPAQQGIKAVKDWIEKNKNTALPPAVKLQKQP